MSGPDLLRSIRRSEGRTLLCEVLHPAVPLVDGVTNAGLAVAFGADLVLLNMYSGGDLAGLRSELGRPVGVNLEPSDAIPALRRASRENVRRLSGADFFCLTANPDAAVETGALAEAARMVRKVREDALVFCGKMHGSGGRGLAAPEEVERLAALSDAVLVPAPGTVPGSQEVRVSELVEAAHGAGALAVAAVGTSQEGADEATVREISLAAKRCGADVLHLGDAGVSGMTPPENIVAASLAIRGRRHTYRRMALR
jgi:hypothetical protein